MGSTTQQRSIGPSNVDAVSSPRNVSIGFVADGATQVGVVYDPPADALYHAHRGGGAFCQVAARDVPARAAATRDLAGSYVVLGHHDRSFDARYFDIRRRMMESGVAMRNFGSAALQLAHVASGRLDGFVELQLSWWDAVAGLLLVEEAGGWHAPVSYTHLTLPTNREV